MSGAFERMRETAVEWLSGKDPETLARNVGAVYDAAAGVLRMTTLGTEATLSLPDYRFTPPLDPWQELVLLHCLRLADGSPPTGRPLAFREMRDGAVRGGNFDRQSEGKLGRLASLPRAELRRRCARLGGREKSGTADFTAEFTLLPCCPLTLKLWASEEDIPASGRLLADANIDRCLTVEDAVMLGGYIVDTLLAGL